MQLINATNWGKEELFGLSAKAIGRWSNINEIAYDSKIVKLLLVASEKLFFLANRSQDQITDEYAAISSEISEIYIEIQRLVKNQMAKN